MKKHLRAGFTLIELMLVVAIVGILAAVAIPQFLEFTLRSKQVEASMILGDIKTHQYTTYAAHDCFAIIQATPAIAPPPGTKGPWVSASVPGTPFCGGVAMTMADVGITPAASDVYYQYECAAVDTLGVTTNFTCTARGDLDADGNVSEFAFCTDLDNDGLGLPTPGLGTPCPFPNELVRLSVARY